MYCELCGSPIRGKSYRVKIEGAALTICERCYRRLSSKPGKIELIISETKKKTFKKTIKKRLGRSRYVEYEVVDNYYEIIRKARLEKGISISQLAQKVMEKENVLRRIEQGRLRPPIQLAERLEKALGVKLLEPVIDYEEEGSLGEKIGEELTLGDLANIKIKKRR